MRLDYQILLTSHQTPYCQWPNPPLCMIVFHQSNCVSAIKRTLFCYHHVSILVFFHAFVRFVPLPFKSTALSVREKMLYNTTYIYFVVQRHRLLFYMM